LFADANNQRRSPWLLARPSQGEKRFVSRAASALACKISASGHLEAQANPVSVPVEERTMSLGSLFAIVLAIVAVMVAAAAIRTVRQGFEYTVERLGRFTKVLGPGFHLIIPFIDRIGRKVNMMEQVLDIPGQEVITKDNAMVQVDGVVFFQVLDAAKAAYEVADLYKAIQYITTTNLRTVLGSMDLDETLSHRDAINARLLDVVDKATSAWGVKITRVEVKDIRPPADISNAMARQMKAERERRAVVLEAEGERNSQILRAEGLKQAQILEAEGRREAAFRDAEARERSAEAEAAATRMVSEAISAGNQQAINYFVAQKYVEAMTAFAQSPNAKTILLPVEATAALGSLGGIAELWKAVAPDDGGAPAAASRTARTGVPFTQA
jgi:regulator of protease activity HflC (stomatin/prohibitin superfamily)